MATQAFKGGKKLSEKSGTVKRIGSVRNLRALAPEDRALVLIKIHREKGAEAKAQKDARIGLAASLWKGNYERAMRYAREIPVDSETGRDEKHAVAIGWVRTLVDCGKKEEADALDNKYKVGAGTFRESMIRVAEERYGKERAKVMREFEDAIKWGDTETAGKLMQEHGLTRADKMLAIFYLIAEFREQVLWKKEMLPHKKFSGMGAWGYIWESGLGDVAFSRYREGYGNTYCEHAERLTAELMEVDRVHVAGRITDDARWMRGAAWKAMEALIGEGRYKDAKEVGKMVEGKEAVEYAVVLEGCAARGIARNPDLDTGEFEKVLGGEKLKKVAVQAAMSRECGNPRAVAEKFGVLEEVRREGTRELAVYLADNAFYLMQKCGEDGYLGLDALATEWGITWPNNIAVNPGIRSDFTRRHCMDEGDVREAAMLALRLIEGNADEMLQAKMSIRAAGGVGGERRKRDAKLFLADAMGLEGTKNLLEMVSELIG